MAKKRRKIAPGKTTKAEETRKIEKNKPGLLRWGESYTSLLLGIIVVIIGVLFIASFFKIKHTQQVSSTNTALNVITGFPSPTVKPTIAITSIPTPEPTIVQQKPVVAEQTYAIQAGDDLWKIAEKFYKSGYNWVDIARANKLENPNMLFSGNTLIIPAVTPAQQTIIAQGTPVPLSNQKVVAVQESMNNHFAIKTDTYTVQKGDDLWNIAVRSYADGYRWIDIAKANNLANPGLIHSGNILKIPR